MTSRLLLFAGLLVGAYAGVTYSPKALEQLKLNSQYDSSSQNGLGFGSSTSVESHKEESHEEPHHDAHYHYKYAVEDHHTGDKKSHEESRNGYKVEGKYSVVDPDGHKRTVKYTSDKHTGFQAEVHREPIHNFEHKVVHDSNSFGSSSSSGNSGSEVHSYGQSSGAHEESHEEPSHEAHYNFKYAVNDDHTGDKKSHEESRHGYKVEGKYTVVDPDGHKRIVKYTSDKHTGFQAEVHREPIHNFEHKDVHESNSYGSSSSFGSSGSQGISYGHSSGISTHEESHEEPSHEAHYNFKYAVNDDHTGDKKSHEESRNGYKVEGKYTVVDPDGHKRIVKYTSDKHTGFQAEVHREPIHNFEHKDVHESNSYGSSSSFGSSASQGISYGHSSGISTHEESHEEPSHEAHYHFKYAVNDDHTGDKKSHEESRNGYKVEGKYTVVDPDGHKRTVKYTSDKHTGFQAQVHRQETHHHIPEPVHYETSKKSESSDGHSSAHISFSSPDAHYHANL